MVDRYGGTHLATCLRELLASRHGNALRGGVLVIASDGWDSDDPERAGRRDGPDPAARAPGGVAQPAGGRARVRAAGRVDGRGAAVLRRVPARAHGPRR